MSTMTATIPAGGRVYAIGDLHGRLDLFEPLWAAILDDDRRRPPATTSFIFLGDYIDRGRQSAALLDRLIAVAAEEPGARFLMGNHEELFLAALDGNVEATRVFLRAGGRETVLSYGLSEDDYDRAGFDDVIDKLRAMVPSAHRRFLDALEPMVVVGDYVFVHAGIRPGVPLADQSPSDLRWIRNPFLEHRECLEKVVVHGHTISDEVEVRPHRIGLDTGAFNGGALSAIGLEAGRRWVLQRRNPD